MTARRFYPWAAFFAGALLVLAIGWLMPSPPASTRAVQHRQDQWVIWALLAKLEKECDPNSPSNDYAWSSNAPPTERRRREILEQLQAVRDIAAREVRHRLQERRSDEFGEMLIVIAASLGDWTMRTPAAKLMAYSAYPAVRLCAARELRKLRDPRTVEWFEYAAAYDDRFVRNDGCGRSSEVYYPVRTVAELALQDMGVMLKSTR